MTNRLVRTSDDFNVLAMVKGDERYVFKYRDDQKGEVLRSFGRLAANHDVSFCWYDAAQLSRKVRETAP